MKDLIGKRILFVSPKTFNYELEIKRKLEELGAQVDYFDERPSNSPFIKASIRINRFPIRNIINRHYEKIIEANYNKKYNYIFFIHLETPFPKLLKRLKNSNPQGKYMLYMWDSMIHCPNTTELVKYFDVVFTFDRLDSLRYNFRYRPLFFLNDYSKPYSQVIKYDISFIGTIHSDRYSIISQLRKQASELNLTTKWYLFMHNKALFYKLKFSNWKNFDANIQDFSFVSLNIEMVIKILQKSKMIIDIQHPENDGLTMRTLEVLGLKKKLITTNKDIIHSDFYDANNIYIIDRLNPKLNSEFFNTDYHEVEPEIYWKYSIDNWIKEIFETK